jgi:hypothetical protein
MKKAALSNCLSKSSGDSIYYAKLANRSSRLTAASKPPGFLGLLSPFGGLSLGGFSRGTTTGGVPFGGGGFLSPSRCAIAATDKPATSNNVNKKCFKNFITFLVSSLLNFRIGESGRPASTLIYAKLMPQPAL